MQQPLGEFPLDVDDDVYADLREAGQVNFTGYSKVYTSHSHHPHQPSGSLNATLLLIFSASR